jgi:hypothetical protein
VRMAGFSLWVCVVLNHTAGSPRAMMLHGSKSGAKPMR